MATIFDHILSGKIESAGIYEDNRAYAFMDAFPQSEGHCLIIPKVAVVDIFSISADDLAHIAQLSQKIARALQKAFSPDGIRIMQLNGKAAGQTVFHYHLHLIPHWQDKPQNQHAQTPVDMAVLKAHAEKIRAVL